MTQAKHTPGPWKIIATNVSFTIVGADGVHVMKTSWHGHVREHYPLMAEALVNITLASAALELLAVAKRLEYAARMEPGKDRLAAFQTVAEEARAAIAKAEGRP
ncbi:hypothetical protein FPY71_10250 [Aureimonas fodinaquatilis]|uniref:Uncharacterized protein n=1 Tax=Aureimonas fodinaquatilis TaxID=2565783 RepID=A0A5B0DY86_9HYPH|nr:hypothetical protein [Aureimonas fodinaquatilis]KAA0970845.1 hypothetical protein FPY71_10250 [Aureimonas fodinaquatilis]